MVTESIYLAPFNTIEIHGASQVFIKNKQAQNKIVITAPKSAFKHHKIRIKVMGHRLYINAYNHPLQTTVYAKKITKLIDHSRDLVTLGGVNNQVLSIDKNGAGSLMVKGYNIRLQKLTIKGSGRTLIKGINSKYMYFSDKGTGTVKLLGRVGISTMKVNSSGYLYINKLMGSNLLLDIHSNGLVKFQGLMNVADINFHGSGQLQMYWLKSNALTATVHGSGIVTLAGETKVLNAIVHDKAQLDARYLRANTVFVKTLNDSKADIWANINLFALAENHSDIYYYSKPKYKSRIMRDSGSILNMEEIPSALLNFEKTLKLSLR